MKYALIATRDTTQVILKETEREAEHIFREYLAKGYSVIKTRIDKAPEALAEIIREG